MGATDAATKKYLQNDDVFAGVVNFTLYGGRKVVKPEDLTELDPTEIAIPYGPDSLKGVPEQKYRDVVKGVCVKQDDRATYMIVAVENQTDIHYAMPVKTLLYDAINYSQQVGKVARAHKESKDYKKGNGDEYLSGLMRDDKLTPVITIVLYFGSKHWDAPRTLREMMSTQDPAILEFIPDYKINLIEPAELDEDDFSKLTDSLKLILGFIKCSGDKKMLQGFIRDNEELMNRELNDDECDVINACTSFNPRKTTSEGGITMCKAIEDMITDAVADAVTDAVMENTQKLERKAADNLVKCISRFLRRGGTPDEAIEIFNATEEEIAEASVLAKT